MTHRWYRSAALGSVVALLSGCSPVAVQEAPQAQVSQVASAGATPAHSTATLSSSTPPLAAAELKIASVSNFRDVAGEGSGLRLANGGRMKPGVIYRSAKLSTLDAADLKKLLEAGIAEVIDLRTDSVAASAPDPALAGVSHRLINIYAVYRTPAVSYSTVRAAQQHMRQLNIDFVADPAQRRQVAKVLQLIATPGGPVLIHCTEGKDRTGWVSAILQLAAGANRDQVMAEYLKSNEYRAAIISDRYRARLAKAGLTAARVERALLSVDASYLNAGLDEMRSRFGGLSGYLTKGLGLSSETISNLRQRLAG